MTLTKYGVGQPMRRKEDQALITGEGNYVADAAPADAARMVVVRSPHAHAGFTIGDVSAALESPGVLAVLTAADISGLGNLECHAPIPNTDGSKMARPERPVLCIDVVRHVGDPVAVVIAETEAQARDAAELVEIDWDVRDAVVELEKALEPGVPLVRPAIGSNLAADASVGDKAATEAAFAGAARVVTLTIVNNRLVSNYMETRGCIGSFDPDTKRYTLNVGSQGVHGIQATLCGEVLKIPKERLRVVTGDVGGGFGTKTFTYAEYPLALVAAEKLGRTVVWVADRTEHFLVDTHGRDNVSKAELALDADHRILALKVDTIAGMGSYLSQYGPFIPYLGASMLTGCYRVPAVHARVRAIYTHTAPVDAYRGAGRPEAAYLLERLMDHAAREIGMDPADLRTKNFVTSAEMPYKTALGRIYDTGDFDGQMRRALEAADRDGLIGRVEASRAAGRMRGLGFATYIECCAFGDGENATVTLEADGAATVLIGTQSNGQGHQTAYAQMVAQHLDIPLEKITVVQGDSDRIATGGGTGGSRSIPLGGVAVGEASRSIAGALKRLAAAALEASESELEIADGYVAVVGRNRSLSFPEIMALPGAKPEHFTVTSGWTQPNGESTYPNGTHVCEVEIDPDTGMVAVERYTIVDDFGVVLNPLLLEGQIHGGIVQGIGQALQERTHYDPESGQLITATLTDYQVPRAEDVPYFHFETRNVPSTTNPLGLKGAGEAGSIGACPAVMNAVVDALFRGAGIDRIDMPATPLAVWSALQAARKAKAA